MAFSAWERRHTVTLLATAIDSALTGFTNYLDFQHLDAEFWTYVRSDGRDIRVANSSGEQIPQQVVGFSRANETGGVFFKLDRSASVDDVVYIYYGNPQAESIEDDATYGHEQAWSSNYSAVYVLHRGAETSSGSVHEATGNLANATATAGLTYGTMSTGEISWPCWDTLGSVRINLTGSSAIAKNSDQCRIVFCLPQTDTGNDGIASSWDNPNGVLQTIKTDNTFSTYANGTYHDATGTNAFDGNAHFVVARLKADTTVSCYVDGTDYTGTAAAETFSESGKGISLNAFDVDLTTNKGDWFQPFYAVTNNDVGVAWLDAMDTMFRSAASFATVSTAIENPDYSAPSLPDVWANCEIAIEGALDMAGTNNPTFGWNAVVGGLDDKEILLDGASTSFATVAYDATSMDWPTGSDWTIMVFFAACYDSNSEAIAGRWNATGGNELWNLYEDASRVLKLDVSEAGGTVDHTLTVSAANMMNSIRACVTIQYQSGTNTLRAKLNNNSWASTTVSTFNASTANLILGGPLGAYGQYTRGAVGPYYHFSEALSDSEIASVIRSHRRLYWMQTPNTPTRIISFAGDSITAGYTPDAPKTVREHAPNPYPELVETELIALGDSDQVCVNLGSRSAKASAELPDIFTYWIDNSDITDVVTAMGVNDIRGGGDTGIQTQASRDAFRSSCEGNGITVWDMDILPWAGDVNWDSTKQTYTDYVNAQAALKANYIAVYDAVEDDVSADEFNAAGISSDDIHPNQTGYEQIAEAIAPQLLLATAKKSLQVILKLLGV